MESGTGLRMWLVDVWDEETGMFNQKRNAELKNAECRIRTRYSDQPFQQYITYEQHQKVFMLCYVDLFPRTCHVRSYTMIEKVLEVCKGLKLTSQEDA